MLSARVYMVHVPWYHLDGTWYIYIQPSLAAVRPTFKSRATFHHHSVVQIASSFISNMADVQKAMSEKDRPAVLKCTAPNCAKLFQWPGELIGSLTWTNLPPTTYTSEAGSARLRRCRNHYRDEHSGMEVPVGIKARPGGRKRSHLQSQQGGNPPEYWVYVHPAGEHNADRSGPLSEGGSGQGIHNIAVRAPEVACSYPTYLLSLISACGNR